MSGPDSSGTSRRTLLVAAGGVTVGGVASGGRVAAGSSPTPRQEVTVSRDEALPPSPFDRAPGDVDVAVAATERDVVDGIERFVAGEVDVVHARRPLLPGEEEAIGERDDAGFESIAGTAFARETGAWRSPLRDGEVVTLRESNSRAGTWAELARDASVSGFEEHAIGSPPDGTAVARGVRPGQYAEGHGGLGYYRLPADGIVPAENAEEGATLTPLVGLRYTYVNGERLDRRAVERYLDLFARETGRYASLEPFPEPNERAVDPLY